MNLFKSLSFFPNPPCLTLATSPNMNRCSAECDISSQNFSVSRLFFYYFESLSLGLKNGLSILVSVSKLLVSKRRLSLGLDHFGLKKVSVSVLINNLVSSLLSAAQPPSHFLFKFSRFTKGWPTFFQPDIQGTIGLYC